MCENSNVHKFDVRKINVRKFSVRKVGLLFNNYSTPHCISIPV